MKCQYCDREATVHITELTEDSSPQEVHLCERCAQKYLDKTLDEPSPSLAGNLAHHIKISETASDLARLDQQECPDCGITFFDFRSVGRLGCPHDYQCFEKDLEPLIQSIHGKTVHIGKRPRRGGSSASRRADLVRLRREMKECVEREDYERAGKLRDEIRRIEQEGPQPSPPTDDTAADDPSSSS